MARDHRRFLGRVGGAPTRPRRRGGLLLALALVAGAAPGQARNLALLVGVGDYQDEAIHGLEGPPHDVTVLRDLLIQRWGFAAPDVHTLVDREATRAAILRGLDALAEGSAPGDEVLFYFSGHGTSAADPLTSLPLPQSSGAIVPADAKLRASAHEVVKSLIVGKDDLRPRFAKLDQGGRRLTVLFDSCYSGSAARGMLGFPARYQDFSRAITDDDPMTRRRHGSADRPPADPWPYDSVFFLSAASDWEKADDVPQALLRQRPTFDGKPHGAFTDALLRVLAGQLPADGNGDGQLSHEELKAALVREVKSKGHDHQPQSLPQAKEDQHQLAQRSLFGHTASNVARPTARPPYRVRLEGTLPALREQLARAPGLELVSGTADLVIKRTAQALTLSTGGGEAVSTFAADAGALVYDRVMQLNWFHQMSWRGDADNPFRFRLGLSDETRGSRLFRGEKFSLNLQLDRQAWLVILYADSSGEVAALYPYVAGEAAPLAAGQSLTIPAAGTPLLVVQDPLGTDLVVAYAFTERPAFLEALVGRAKLATNESLYQQIVAAVAANPTGVAVATLALITQERPAK